MSDDREPVAGEYFDDDLATHLVGATLLVGIAELKHDGSLVRRYQVFGVVTVADPTQGICVREHTGDVDFWLPPDTRGVTPAEPGEYRNRSTGEVVVDPDYLGSWEIIAPEPTH
jgi:hypothetical protein